MSSKKIFLIITAMVLVSSDDDFKGRYRKNVSKGARFLSFNTSNDDITVGLDFNIPFLTIPVRKTMNSTFGFAGLGLPTVNINISSLLLGGIVVLGSALIPFLLKNHNTDDSQLDRARMSDSTVIGTADVLNIFNVIMRDPNGVHGCAERIACWTGQKTDAGSLKILNQIISNDILSSIFNTTTIEDAMKFGHNGQNCDLYTPCPLHEKHIVKLINRFSSMRHSSNND